MIDERQFSIATPIGSVTSDSGNHLGDVLSVMIFISFVFIGNVVVKHIKKKFKK